MKGTEKDGLHLRGGIHLRRKLHLLHLFAFNDAMAQNPLFEIISIGYAEIALHFFKKK
jgi:hypothetical protein